MGTLPFPFSIFPPFPSPPLSSPPLSRSAPWKPARGSGSSVSFPSGVWGEAPAAYAFWCILSLKIAPGGKIFFYKRPKKKIAIGKKCRNDVQKFTPTKISVGDLEFPEGGISPPRLYVWKKHCGRLPSGLWWAFDVDVRGICALLF